MISRSVFLSLFAIATLSAAQAVDVYAQGPAGTHTTPVAVKTSNLAVPATSKIPIATDYFPITALDTLSTAPAEASDSLTLSAAGYMVSETIPSFLTMVMAMMLM